MRRASAFTQELVERNSAQPSPHDLPSLEFFKVFRREPMVKQFSV